MSDKLNLDMPITQASLIRTLTDRIQGILEEAEQATQPLEMEPHRSRLFELFVMADGAGLLGDDFEPNLSSDSLAATLADRWQLRDAAQNLRQVQPGADIGNIARIRLLWSLLRMWMEWSYAWQRWSEFHDGPPADATAPQADDAAS